jgi:prevent-host-death family protein
MREVQATQAKALLPELLQTVERGETIAITRHGKTIAHLVPAEERERARRKEAIDRFLEQRARWKPTGITLDEILAWRHEGHLG